jgi:hypothetical protein
MKEKTLLDFFGGNKPSNISEKKNYKIKYLLKEISKSNPISQTKDGVVWKIK